MPENQKLEWHHIAYPHEITDAAFPVNTLKQLKLDSRKYTLARTKEGFFAVDDACPHAGGSLSNGWCDAKGNVICPLHRYGFNLKTGRNAAGSGPSTRAYATDLRTDGLYIGLEKNKWWQW
ncbi:MAG: hypothetical protein EOP53_06320 [Sphingobacteriales bacterium]|nr:MAG: hypothetical protein EOP53_06320 [Sphingobacteriales bacterium]